LPVSEAGIVKSDVKRNAFLLAAGLVCNSGMFQLAAALSSLTLVAVTGVKGILGLGPAIFLASSGLAVGPAGRLSDRFGRMAVIRVAFVGGAAGCGVVAAGCAAESGVLVGLGLALIGGSGGIIQLSRAAAAEMFPPDRRARGMSFVLFGAVSGAIWGPVLFGPLFAHREITAHGLVAPWLIGIPFMLAGLAVSGAVRPDPRDISRRYRTADELALPAAPVREILRRPGVAPAVVAVVASFAVMASVMNLAGYVAVGRGHHEGDVFTMISVHILGMYGLVLIVGDVLDRFGRRPGLYTGLALMTVSNAALTWLGGVGGMSLALFGLGLGWNLSYVAATTELVSLTAAHERGRIVGFGDLCASFTAAGLALLGGVVYTAAGVTVLALAAAALAALPAMGIAARIRYTGAPADAASASSS
jgi:MFS family permease